MRYFLDMLYPRSCLGCGLAAPKPFGFICWDCWADTVKVTPPFCRCCGDPVAGQIDHDFICYACTERTPAFTQARSVARYDGVMGEALRRLKYGRALWMAEDMAELMRSCMQAEYAGYQFDLIVPVPLHFIRRRIRGYNQAALLAKALGRRLRCPVRPRLLRRRKRTLSQTNLTAKERLSNVSGAFQYRGRGSLAGQHVLLIDDVMTTGATVDACARALRKGGAESVYVITAARG